MVRLGNFLFKYRNLVFPVLFVLLVFGTEPFLGDRLTARWIYAAGFLIALSGQVVRALTIGLAYIVRGGKDKKVYAKALVKDGIFAHCRNPLYLGNLLIVTGLGVAADSALFYFVGLPFFVLAYLAIIRAEESYLADRFGEEYEEYLSRVNRLVPDLSGIGTTLSSMTFNWRRLLVKEYGTTYAWTTAMIALILKNQYLLYGREISGRAIRTAALAFAAVTVFYAVVRFLKKTERLVGDMPVPADPPPGGTAA